MSAPTLRIPESVADDPSDVADALEVAGALWSKGQSEEAIRWLRRAVSAASDADDAVRAAGLAGAAADLEEAVKRPSAVLPAAPAPAESATASALPGPASEAKAEPVEAKAEPVEAKAEAGAIAAPVAAPSTTAALALGHALQEPPHDPHDPHDAAEATVPDTPAAISVHANGTSPASVPPRASSVPAPRSTFAKPPVIHPTHSPTALPDLPSRMRVSVKTSVRDAGLLFVRALADGEEAPPGTLEAFLVRDATEANGDAPGEESGTREETGTPEGSAP